MFPRSRCFDCTDFRETWGCRSPGSGPVEPSLVFGVCGQELPGPGSWASPQEAWLTVSPLLPEMLGVRRACVHARRSVRLSCTRVFVPALGGHFLGARWCGGALRGRGDEAPAQPPGARGLVSEADVSSVRCQLRGKLSQARGALEVKDVGRRSHVAEQRILSDSEGVALTRW